MNTFTVGLTFDHLKHTNAVILEFDRSRIETIEEITIKTRFDEIEDFDEFLVIDVDTLYVARQTIDAQK